MYSLVTPELDPRMSVQWQGEKGACAAYAATEIAWMLFALAGMPCIDLSGSDLYERDRKKESGANWRADTGSTLADNLDFAIGGLYADADAPESDDLTRDYDQLTAGKTTYQGATAHLPFYAGENGDPDFFVKAICASLLRGQPVDLGMCWPDPWFNPDANGILPSATPAQYAGAGGHSFYAYEYRPIHGGLVLGANHWNQPGGAVWNPQIVNLGGNARPGEIAIPIAFLRPRVNPYLEGRAVTGFTHVQPAPQPSWTPDPAAVAGLNWERDEAGWIAGAYPASGGDLTVVAAEQARLAQYANSMANYFKGARKHMPALPTKVGGSAPR